MRISLIFILLLAFMSVTEGQSRIPSQQRQAATVANDTTSIVKVKKGSIFQGRPGKAALYSLIIPGAGQIYNKSYLRVPFVYAGVGIMGYFLISNTRNYQCFREAYIQAIDGVPYDLPSNCPASTAAFIERVSEPSTLRLYRDRYDRQKQNAILGLGLVWLANSIDAYVNAHLKDFDVNEDLSRLQIRPKFDLDDYSGSTTIGIVLTF